MEDHDEGRNRMYRCMSSIGSRTGARQRAGQPDATGSSGSGHENTPAGGATINDCTAYDNLADYGIYCLNGSTIKGCVASGNTGSGAQTAGLYASAGSIIMECLSRSTGHTNGMATASQGMGIFVNGSAGVKDCTTRISSGDGIRVSSGCSVVGNDCHDSGYSGDGAGIHATNYDTTGIQPIGLIVTTTGTISSTSHWANFSY